MMISPVNYSIALHTGEIIKIAEFDPEIVIELNDVNIRSILHDIIQYCSEIYRGDIEDAKVGNTKKFTKFLKTPPIGALLKLTKPACLLAGACSAFQPKICSTKSMKNNKSLLPICWEYNIQGSHDKKEMPEAQDLAFAIVHSWREGRYAIIVKIE